VDAKTAGTQPVRPRLLGLFVHSPDIIARSPVCASRRKSLAYPSSNHKKREHDHFIRSGKKRGRRRHPDDSTSKLVVRLLLRPIPAQGRNSACAAERTIRHVYHEVCRRCRETEIPHSTPRILPVDLHGQAGGNLPLVGKVKPNLLKASFCCVCPDPQLRHPDHHRGRAAN
jgi:hypothetical protein